MIFRKTNDFWKQKVGSAKVKNDCSNNESILNFKHKNFMRNLHCVYYLSGGGITMEFVKRGGDFQRFSDN